MRETSPTSGPSSISIHWEIIINWAKWKWNPQYNVPNRPVWDPPSQRPRPSHSLIFCILCSLYRKLYLIHYLLYASNKFKSSQNVRGIRYPR